VQDSHFLENKNARRESESTLLKKIDERSKGLEHNLHDVKKQQEHT